MRVAVTIERFVPEAGGVERVAHHQVTELARRGVDVCVVCRRASAAPPPGVELVRLRVPALWQPARVALFSIFAARATRDGFDVVHGLSRTRRQQIYRAGAGSHAAYMEHMYPDPERRRWLSPRHRAILRIEEAVFQDSTQVIQCNARMNALEIARRYDVPADRLITLYNGVDTERYHPGKSQTAGEAMRTTLRLDGPLALFAGSGFQRKGLDRAIDGLSRASVAADLLVAGRGDPAPYRALARQKGVEKRVHFLGHRSDLHVLYAAADLFVLPTRYDPFANSCLEAMACGTPVATTSTNGASELIVPGVNGWIGADDFAPAFELLSDPKRVRAMGESARSTAEQLTWSKYTDRLLALYELVAR